jgi:hypothetical protein
MKRILLVLAVGAIMVLSSVDYAFAETKAVATGQLGRLPAHRLRRS